MRIKPAIGNGLSMCKRCQNNNRWAVSWTSFLYRIEGMEYLYCRKCVQEIAYERNEKIYYLEEKEGTNNE